MRDRLADMIDGFFGCDSAYFDIDKYELADYLLANGVIVPPMPMADWLREELTEYVCRRVIDEL